MTGQLSNLTYLASQARAEEMRQAAARSTERPTGLKRLFRSF
jgi:hypothetical protein